MQAKIYENFPKIQHEDEDENLAGAKIYVSDICSKYTLGDDTSSPAAHQKLHEVQQKIKVGTAQIELQMPKDPRTGLPTAENLMAPVPTLRRKIFFGIFLVACILYVIVPIIDAATS